MMSGRPQGTPYYRTPPQQQIQTPPGPPYGSQDPLAHGGYYPPFFQPHNSNAPPVGHPSPHTVNIMIYILVRDTFRNFRISNSGSLEFSIGHTSFLIH